MYTCPGTEGVVAMVATVWTVGHSDLETGQFLRLLVRQGVTAVADLRSEPYSRHAPQFCKRDLKDALRDAGIGYVFLGRELGGRTDEAGLLTDGRVDFEKLAGAPDFLVGLDRLRHGAATHRVALLCAEKDPLHCHRALLVSRHLRGPTLEVQHIHADGTLESHVALERRLLEAHGLGEEDLFTPFETRLHRAYVRQAERVAFRPERDTAS